MTEDHRADRGLVLVVCTGNSCRSQMAEGFLRERAAGRLRAASAGTEPAVEVHPLAVEVMAEVGIDISRQRPESHESYLGRPEVDTLILVCEGAAKSCPAPWPGVRERLFWPFEDPALCRGTRQERLTKFREVRDRIGRRVDEWLGAERQRE